MVLQDLTLAFSITFATLWSVLLIVVEATAKRAALTYALTSVGFLLLITMTIFPSEQGYAFSEMLRVSPYSQFANFVFALSGLLVVTLSQGYLVRERIHFGEYYVIVFIATLGMMLMASAGNMAVLFIGLETMSIALYVLAGIMRKDKLANEAAMKYFLLGAFSSSVFLYGVALIYGATGEMTLFKIGIYLQENGASPLFWIGLALLTMGFLFKISAVPFHQWTPDVYEGAPTPSAALMSTASKAAAFVAFITVILNVSSQTENNANWQLALSTVAVLTMVVGNLAALAQENLKRMLAFSSIAHAGYMLVGVVAASDEGYGAALYYSLVYSLMNIGAFGVIALIERHREGVNAADYAGLFKEKPALAGVMALFMLSLTGVPPLAGFVGKYKLFAAAVESGMSWLAIVGVLASAVSAYYYLRVVIFMFMREPQTENQFDGVATSPTLVIIALLVFLLGIFPTGMLRFASEAMKFASRF
ncbi:MAG: NADH-quinone oxidoreductase subunit N [Chloroherpetonaceae bacterium]|nr:NADH-quinone oxidoreductase subunit N [Chloroherpetonaceae bacterium]MDW8438068.1 NADH-quinone oxidoreductase subunit N [Chloroherpetonaceae bacterium]